MEYCDLQTGLCGESQEAELEALTLKPAPLARVLYATDPICSHCWAMEPAWRKLLFHYGDRLEFRHLFGGLLPGWAGFADRANSIGQPADVAPHWAEVAERFGQPIDPSVWLTDPIGSSFPPSVAVHTVRPLAPNLEEAYLRRLRQAVFLEARNIARPEVLIACAADVGIDAARFTSLWEAQAGQAPFEQELAEVRRLPVRGFPTVIIQGRNGQGLVLRGTQPYDRLEAALLQVTELPKAERVPTAAEALQAYGSGTTREFAELLGLSADATRAALLGAGAVQRPIAGDALWERR